MMNILVIIVHAISGACMHAMRTWPAASELPLFVTVQCIGSVMNSYNSVNNTTSCMECVLNSCTTALVSECT